MDMNESASLVIAAMAMNGQTLANFVSAFAATGHYADEMNLYEYVRGNPVNGSDAAGLFAYVDLMGATALRADLMSMDGDCGVSLAGAIRGLVGFFSYRNLLLSDLAEVELQPNFVDGWLKKGGVPFGPMNGSEPPTVGRRVRRCTRVAARRGRFQRPDVMF